jgi:hypothetical protein
MDETKDHNPAIFISRYRALRIVVKPSYNKEVDGRIATVNGTSVQFESGEYRTTDPEIISYLESQKMFGDVYIRVPDNVKDIAGKKEEWMKTLEQREADLKVREDAIAKKEAKINGSEEGAKVKTDGETPLEKMEYKDLVKIAKDKKVFKNGMKKVELIEAIKIADGSASGKGAF